MSLNFLSNFHPLKSKFSIETHPINEKESNAKEGFCQGPSTAFFVPVIGGSGTAGGGGGILERLPDFREEVEQAETEKDPSSVTEET